MNNLQSQVEGHQIEKIKEEVSSSAMAKALSALGAAKSMGIAPSDPFKGVATPGLGWPSQRPFGPFGPASPGLPGLPGPGLPTPWPPALHPNLVGGWEPGGLLEIIERQRREEERQRAAAMDAVKRQFEMEALGRAAFQREAEAKAQRARGFAEGVESAQGALGARHFLRQALADGHELGLRRCWAAVAERGWEAECLAAGKSETMLAATLGSNPVPALAFLAEMDFEPGAKVATQALRAAMAGNAAGPALEALCRDFGAGALDEAVIKDLERRQKGLGELARSRGEAYELEALAAPKGPAVAARPCRL